ncbi:uncharacterized protein LOC101854811 [Aplysia californica]|uniref:Uncharacterized protein LOC101854811 n=1 Tax=Aplysia californica TaxID=6500 RepID=A0ABM1A4Y7_APLCA|nr:uncharacterized protein LOC101854811 [Aplysia californica]
MKQQNLRLIDLFRSLDVNHDNAISKQELRNGFLSLNMQLPEGVFGSAFSKLDLNSNGIIDIDELKNAHRRVLRQTMLMMVRSKSNDENEGYGDLLHEFQKLVREAANKRKLPKQKEEPEEQGKAATPGRRTTTRRPTLSARRVSSINQSPITAQASSQSTEAARALDVPASQSQSSATRRLSSATSKNQMAENANDFSLNLGSPGRQDQSS